MMKEANQTKQKPVAKLSGFCYTIYNLSILWRGCFLNFVFNFCNQFAPPNVKILVVKDFDHLLFPLNFILNIGEKNLTPSKMDIPITWQRLLKYLSIPLLIGVRYVNSFSPFRGACCYHIYLSKCFAHFRYKYSKLTNTCQNCVLKLCKSVLIYQHKIVRNLLKCVYAPIYFNTLLTENGVMMP